jgi:hypothetical protein
MAAKVKVQFKHKKGVLHIGGGRFFYPGEPVEVTAAERDQLLDTYPDDLVEVKVSKGKGTTSGDKADTSATEEGK